MSSDLNAMIRAAIARQRQETRRVWGWQAKQDQAKDERPKWDPSMVGPAEARVLRELSGQ